MWRWMTCVFTFDAKISPPRLGSWVLDYGPRDQERGHIAILDQETDYLISAVSVEFDQERTTAEVVIEIPRKLFGEDPRSTGFISTACALQYGSSTRMGCEDLLDAVIYGRVYRAHG
jgi:hypothetical protein